MTKTTWRRVCTASGLAAYCVAAAAQSYIGGDVSVLRASDVTYTLPTTAIPRHPTEFGTGWGMALRGGWRFASNSALGGGQPRAELELSWRRAPVDRFGGEGDVGSGTGRMNVLALMGNGYIDFQRQGAWRPYLGLGIGWLRGTASDIRRDLSPGDCCTGIIDGRDEAAAWQAIAGIGYAINAKLTLTADLRYLASAGNLMQDYRGACAPDGSLCLGQPGTTAARFVSQSLALGLRYDF